MVEEDIYEEDGKFVIKKEINGKLITFGTFDSLYDAIEERDELEDYGWPYRPEEDTVKEVEKFIFEEDGRFFISKKILDKEMIFGNFDSLERAKSLKRKLIDNAWHLNFQTRPTKYGKYISKTKNKRFLVSKDFNGEIKRFGYYKTLEEDLLVRDNLVSANWEMGEEYILSNIGIENVDFNIGKISRKYAVYKWEDDKCTIFGIYRSHRAAKKIKNRLLRRR